MQTHLYTSLEHDEHFPPDDWIERPEYKSLRKGADTSTFPWTGVSQVNNVTDAISMDVASIFYFRIYKLDSVQQCTKVESKASVQTRT